MLYITSDVGLYVREKILKGHSVPFWQMFDDGVELEDFAMRVEFCGDVVTFEEVVAERVEIFEVANFFISPIPKYTLKPLYFPFEEGYISIGLNDLVTIVFDFFHHFYQYLETFGFDNFFPDDLQDVVEFLGVLPRIFELLIFFRNVLEKGFHILLQDQS